MFTRNQIDLTDGSLLLFGVLDHLSEIRADQSGDSLNERQLDTPVFVLRSPRWEGYGLCQLSFDHSEVIHFDG